MTAITTPTFVSGILFTCTLLSYFVLSPGTGTRKENGSETNATRCRCPFQFWHVYRLAKWTDSIIYYLVVLPLMALSIRPFISVSYTSITSVWSYFHLFMWMLFWYFRLKLKSQTVIYPIPNNNTLIIINNSDIFINYLLSISTF